MASSLVIYAEVDVKEVAHSLLGEAVGCQAQEDGDAKQ